jgi:hypothetical protein
MTRHFGWARRKTFYLLADLKELRLLESTGHLTEEHGTRLRRMNVSAFFSQAGVQDSKTGVQDSRAGVQSNDAHNRHLTGADGNSAGGGFDFEVPAVDVKAGQGAKSSSALPDRKADDDSARQPDWESIESKIETNMQSAKNVLLRRGHEPHFVDAALQSIKERSDHSGSIPSSTKYFLDSFDRVLADPRDKATITNRAEQRARIMPTAPELLASAEELERESKAIGQPIKVVLENRLRKAHANRG